MTLNDVLEIICFWDRDGLRGACSIIIRILCNCCVKLNLSLQHVLERGKPHERSRIIEKLIGNVVQLSQHKYASNVVEKCLEYGDSAERELLIEEILADSEANDNLLVR